MVVLVGMYNVFFWGGYILKWVGLLFLSLLFLGFVVGVEAAESTFDVPPTGYYTISFELSGDATVHVEFKVLSGPAVDFLLLDEENYQLFRSQIDEGYYQVQGYIVLQSVRSFERSVSLSAGKYYFVVVNWDLSETASCSINYSVESGGGSLAGFLFLVVSVAVVVGLIVFVLRRR